MLAAEADIAGDAALLKQTVREAGALALSMFRKEIRQWTKGQSSPVSEADIAVDELIRQRLQSATPDYGWLSEETADDRIRLSRRKVWIVDPIDGAPISADARTGRSVPLWSRTAGRGLPPCLRRRPMSSSSPAKAAA